MAKWEVGPTKDVVHALMETLVDPRLPSRVSVDHPPSDDAQKSVAKQMHAVVLLYNYYHRKQKLELEFLDFVSFCKLALLLRPSLISFMKMIKESESVELNDAEDQFSVTEKAVKDACDIAMSLDASKDVPTTEGCPISKVAVLLIDSKKENCLLQFGAVTDGVWSLIEKEINESSISQETLAEENVSKKRKTNNQTDDSEFLQLGCDAVKDVTGIDSSDLVVWEAHVVYSLSKEKSAAQFYMMQCPQSLDINQSVPLKFLVESLQGPLAEKFGDSWTTTTLVEYHHMLPYVGFISGWLSRKDLCVPILNGYTARSTKNYDEKELSQSKIPALPRLKYIGEDLDHIDTNDSETKISSSNEVANENSADYQKKSKHSFCGKTASSVNVVQSTKKNGNVIEEFKNICDILNSAKKGASRITLQKVDNDGENHERGLLPGPSRGLSQSIVRDGNATQRMNMSDSTRSSFMSEERKTLNSNIRVFNQRSKIISCAQNDARGPKDGVNLKVDLLKSNDSLCRDEKITAENGGVIISCNQSGIVATENARVNLEAFYNIEVENALASKDLRNALALLDRRRQELYSQICAMEDTLALYQHSIERIRDGGEVGLARQCIKSIVGGDDHLLLKNEVRVQNTCHRPGEDHSNPQSKNQQRFSDIFLPGKSSCQDLEYICLRNNWRLPRYFVQPSDGKFLSNVVVQSKDFNLSSKGGVQSSPCEARESAAAQMIAKIRNACDRS